MKQINECLDRLFEGKRPLKTKWKSFMIAARLEGKDRTCIYMYHYHHHVLTYDVNTYEVLHQWWEKPADKRGLDAALKYLKEYEMKTRPRTIGDEFRMKSVKIQIETVNSAFAESENNQELARILRQLADQLEYGGDAYFSSIIRDLNGNKCGTVEID